MTKHKTKKSPKGTKIKPKAKAKLKKAVTKRVAKKAITKKNSIKTRKDTKSVPRGADKKKREVHPNSLANLVPGANKEGRPKGKLNFDTRVDLAVEALAIQMAILHNKKKENKNNQIKQEDLDIEGDIFMQLVNKARAGNEKMIDSFLDRRHGKAIARVELTGKDGDPIAYEERKAKAKTKAQRMLKAYTK